MFAVWLTLFALPILILDNIPKTEARAASVKVDAARASTTSTTVATTTTIAEVTTVAAAEVAASPETTPTTSAPKPKTVTVVTSAPTTTTTTAPPNVQQGGASWYDYNPGECAHVSIPKGTVVTITSLETGATTTCVVTDRGPYQTGRIIDLDRATFAQLADPARGVVQVQITW